jgi:hypothetical protein
MSTKRHQAERVEKRAFWRPQINGFLTSNMTAKEYCQKHSLVLHQLKYWQCEIAKEGSSGLSPTLNSDFVEITPAVQPHPPTNLCGGLEIKTHYGFSIILPEVLTAENLSAVLSAVKRLS